MGRNKVLDVLFAAPLLTVIKMTVVNLAIVGVVYAVVPETAPDLPESKAMELISKQMKEQGVYMLPYKFPVEELIDNKRKVSLLNLWMKEGLLIRQNIRLDVTKKVHGFDRTISHAAYRYELNTEDPRVTEKGFSVGTPAIKKIVSISEPRFLSYTWFSMVEFEWYIEDVPEWANDKRMKQFRMTRRAKNSYEQPFEKSLSLEWVEDEGWDNYKGKQKKKPSLF